MIGVMIIGFRRAVFSNEAGLGSAAIAHSTARTPIPGAGGLRRAAGTVHRHGGDLHHHRSRDHHHGLRSRTGRLGCERHRAHHPKAFESTLSWTPVPLSMAAILFAFSTMITWSYYGVKAFTYLVGHHRWADLWFQGVLSGLRGAGGIRAARRGGGSVGRPGVSWSPSRTCSASTCWPRLIRKELTDYEANHTP